MLNNVKMWKIFCTKVVVVVVVFAVVVVGIFVGFVVVVVFVVFVVIVVFVVVVVAALKSLFHDFCFERIHCSNSEFCSIITLKTR